MNEMQQTEAVKSPGFPERHQWLLELLYIAVFGLFCVLWACQRDMYFNPDEYMRAQVPWYIYEHGTLPNGWMAEIRDQNWGFSYAFQPTFLPALIGSTFMRIANFFHSTRYTRMVALRLTSVTAGMGAVFMLFRIGGRVFDTRMKWVMTVLISTIPQFIYLSSYYNCDMLCLFGASMVLYAWLRIFQDGWGWLNSLILSVGMSIIALSYYNGYGWILLSIVFFFLTPVLKIDEKADRKKMVRLFFYIVGLVFVMTGFFFIRNLVIYEGLDLLGSKSMNLSGEMYAIPELKPSIKTSLYEDGVSLWEMFTARDHVYVTHVFRSFFGAFGYIMSYIPVLFYDFYKLAALLGGAGFTCAAVSALRRKTSAYEDKGFSLKKSVFLYILLCLSCLIVFGLHTYYSYMQDYQAQGRYDYPAMPAVALIWATGIDWLRKRPKVVAWIFCVFCALIPVAAFLTGFLRDDLAIFWLG